MSKRGGRLGSILLCVLLGWSWSVEAQELTVDGDVTATSFTGDGGNLTGVPDDISHGVASYNCPAGSTCFVVNDCPANFEVTGGGFFIASAVQATRALVTMHQSYRATATQWLVEATNDSGSALDFYALAECTRVSPTPAAPVVSQAVSTLPPGLDPYQVLLVCPEGDLALFVEPEDALGSHYCPNHGLALQPSGGGLSAILPSRQATLEAPAGEPPPSRPRSDSRP